ncbi:hypothetical protein RF11_00068 [Thelohanellus kitauei]|uniref:Uncharacterized protein n=1 Tax=Thelohanellus kitauei TaxID=669202 RepID=A0A0C2NJ93_THEKT|nr:hypothetical protein RF11_00068 [Thelohanellus kitauei]
MVIGRVIDSLRRNVSSILKTFDVSDRDSFLKKAQNLMSGIENDSAVGSVKNDDRLRRKSNLQICFQRGYIARICPLKNQKHGISYKVGAVGVETYSAVTAQVEDERGNRFEALVDSDSPRSLIKLDSANDSYLSQPYSCGLFVVYGTELIARGEVELQVQIGNFKLP